VRVVKKQQEGQLHRRPEWDEGMKFGSGTKVPLPNFIPSYLYFKIIDITASKGLEELCQPSSWAKNYMSMTKLHGSDKVTVGLNPLSTCTLTLICTHLCDV